MLPGKTGVPGEGLRAVLVMVSTGAVAAVIKNGVSSASGPAVVPVITVRVGVRLAVAVVVATPRALVVDVIGLKVP